MNLWCWRIFPTSPLVNGAVKPGMSTADAGKAQREEMGSLEKECSGNGMRCYVVTLYSGAMYNLYKYKKYDDIRLVFAPEFAMAFFWRRSRQL